MCRIRTTEVVDQVPATVAIANRQVAVGLTGLEVRLAGGLHRGSLASGDEGGREGENGGGSGEDHFDL